MCVDGGYKNRCDHFKFRDKLLLNVTMLPPKLNTEFTGLVVWADRWEYVPHASKNAILSYHIEHS